MLAAVTPAARWGRCLRARDGPPGEEDLTEQDASGQAGVSQVDLHLAASGRGLSASIRDYGPGLDEAEPLLPGRLFRTSKPGGMGIGLALSHATVERLGGTLSMRPAPDGRGVVVSFELPVVEAA